MHLIRIPRRPCRHRGALRLRDWPGLSRTPAGVGIMGGIPSIAARCDKGVWLAGQWMMLQYHPPPQAACN